MAAFSNKLYIFGGGTVTDVYGLEQVRFLVEKQASVLHLFFGSSGVFLDSCIRFGDRLLGVASDLHRFIQGFAILFFLNLRSLRCNHNFISRTLILLQAILQTGVVMGSYN